MTWLTKNLTLDLLAIAIDGMNKAYTRIKDSEGSSPWPPAAQPAQAPHPIQEEQHAPAVAPSPEPEPTPAAPAPEPQPTPEELHTKAQTILRTIAQSGDIEWVTGTLLPHFGVSSLTDVPADKLPELITLATQHAQEAA